MNFEIMNIVVLLVVIIFLLALQVFLSMQKNKWLGLVLPAIYLFSAFLGSFGSMIYTGDIRPIIMVFLLLSIPTVINYVIYLACRAKVKEKNNNEIEKMSIQDLD